ncbi:FAD-binding oxidoreductase [Candidatus Binatia bacterium]|nr:FAD-binding oxidoreductase [Candidatus Binatia bacterium]
MSDFASRSFWLEADPYTASPPLAGDVTVDIAIVGGGFTGLWTAYFLLRAQPSLKVAVIEAEVVGYGASGRNGGFAMTLLGPTLHQFVTAFGVESARNAHAAVARSVDDIGRFCTEHSVDCDYRKTGFIGAALDDSQVPRVEADVRAAETLGLTDVRFIPGDELRREIQSPLYRCGLEEKTGALVNPARLARGLARVVRQLTGVVYEQTPVEGIERGTDAMRIRTRHGVVVADKVVLATNAYSGRFPEFRRLFIPLYSYIVLTEPLSEAQWASIGWQGRQGMEDKRTYIHYYRPTADGRILMGGEDAPYFFGSHVDPAHDRNPALFDRLRRDLLSIYPQLAGIRFTHAWGGPIAVTSRFVPTFGRVQDGRVVYGFGYSGHGVAPSHTGGQILRDLVLDRQSELTDLCFVRSRPVPFPPEPLRWAGVHLARRSLLRQDRRGKPKVDPLAVRLMMKLS